MQLLVLTERCIGKIKQRTRKIKELIKGHLMINAVHEFIDIDR